MKLIFIILAVIFFTLDALRVPIAINCTPAGFACLTVAVLLV